MRPAMKVGVLAAGLTVLVAPWLQGQERARSTAPRRTARGNLLAKAGHYEFAVSFLKTGVRVVPRDAAGRPLDAAGLSGAATFYHPNSPQPWFTRPLRAEKTTPGQTSTSLDLAIGLGNVPATGVKVVFEISGLPDSTESTVTFTVPLEFAPTSPGRPAPLPTPAPTVPRYTYAPGYYGYGYYQYTSPGTAAPAASSPAPAYAAPMYGGSTGVSSSSRDWTTGRSNLPLSKPWLRPID